MPDPDRDIVRNGSSQDYGVPGLAVDEHGDEREIVP